MKEQSLKKLHQFEVMALDEFDRICKKHGLTYYLIGGTLLGAVRHQGFIPWDDDIDVGMPRKDYNEFIRIAQSELPPQLFLQTINSDPGYDHFFAKLRINNTVFMEEAVKSSIRHQGIFIDIFPLDGCKGRFGIMKQIRKKAIIALSNVIRRRRNSYARTYLNKFRNYLVSAVFALFSDKCIVCMVEKMMAGKGDYYINWSGRGGWKEDAMEKIVYNPSGELFFEGKNYSVPNALDRYLSNLYGDDYMELPPVEKRETHNPIRLSFDTNGPDEILD